MKLLKLKILQILLLIFVVSFSSCSSKKNSTKIILKVKTPLGLEKLTQYIPIDNFLTKEKIRLGRDLFFDKRLSIDGTISCAFCHSPLLGFSDGRYFASGVFGLKSKRNSATIINRVFSKKQFLDGRARNIEEAVIEHINDPNVFGNTSENVIKVLNQDDKYRKKFNTVFDAEVSENSIAKALASFVRTIVSGNSPYDQFVAGNKNALSEPAKRGLKLFMSDKLKCSVCHSGQNFTDEKYHNNGAKIISGKVDLGRYLVTEVDSDKGKFKTPTLRDIARTSPYMHNGSIKGLHALIDFYNKGGESSIYKSSLIKPLHLTDAEKLDLYRFLRSLTGTNTYFFGNR